VSPSLSLSRGSRQQGNKKRVQPASPPWRVRRKKKSLLSGKSLCSKPRGKSDQIESLAESQKGVASAERCSCLTMISTRSIYTSRRNENELDNEFQGIVIGRFVWRQLAKEEKLGIAGFTLDQRRKDWEIRCNPKLVRLNSTGRRGGGNGGLLDHEVISKEGLVIARSLLREDDGKTTSRKGEDLYTTELRKGEGKRKERNGGGRCSFEIRSPLLFMRRIKKRINLAASKEFNSAIRSREGGRGKGQAREIDMMAKAVSWGF